MLQILIVEDNKAQRDALNEYLNGVKILGESLDVYSVSDLETAMVVCKEKQIHLVLSDLMLPNGTGIELLEQVHRDQPHIPFLILTGQPSIQTAIEAIRKGAHDYLLKPIDFVVLQKKMETLFETQYLRTENKNLRDRLRDTFQTKGIIGISQTLRSILEKVKQISPVDVTVLLEGESGTGKELIANLIHENSPRANRLFVKINCGALAKTLLESELFGAVRGAYTGAEQDRAGYFESANGGTIFLDEIGEMDLESQVRLLRVLEERKVIRVGSTKPIDVDIRVIAAANKELLEEIDRGNFREDLYYRLSVMKLRLPSLRERKEDIPLLFNHFITQFNEKYQKSVTHMSPELISLCQSYPWPGNIREFRNVLEGMHILAQNHVLQRDGLPIEIQNPAKNRSTKQNLIHNITPGFSLKNYEKAAIASNLNFFHQNREKTAKALGIAGRTLYRKLKEYGL